MADINHKDRAHSEIGASVADRWINCPASVRDSRGIPDSETSYYAAEGTAAHECSEYCFENEIDAKDAIGLTFNTDYEHEDGTKGFIVDEEMAGYVQFYLDKMQTYIDGEYDVSIEERFTLKDIHENAFGSNDFCAMGINNGELIIADFKYGKGKNVDAKDNLQLVYYALGAYFDANSIYDFKTVTMIVVQPRMEGKEYDEWTITIDELESYIPLFKEKAEEVYSENPSYKVGNHCTWCKAKPTCKAMRNKTEELIQNSFDDDITLHKTPALPEVEKMTKDQIVKVLTYQKIIEEWLGSVASHAKEILEKGEELEGFKLVKKRANRKITDEQEVINTFEPTFGDKIYKPKQLETMGKLEKLIGKKELEPYLHKPDTGNQIAPVSDKRPEVVCRADLVEDAFDDNIEKEKSSYDDMEF